MKQYQSHKKVHALPMNRGDYNTYRGWTIPKNEDPEDEGYLVIYNKDTFDHYESWSPKDVFDDGYSEMTPADFCKVFHDPQLGQILVMRDTDEETHAPCVQVRNEPPGLGVCQLQISFPDTDQGNDDCREALANMDLETAVMFAEYLHRDWASESTTT